MLSSTRCRCDWRLPHGRLRVARALLTQSAAADVLRKGAAMVAETACNTDAERTVQRHLTELYAGRLGAA